MGSTWQIRRVVITKEEISFAFVGEEAQIDHIPFAEVLYIKEMTEAVGDDDAERKKFSHAMQIGTRDDGYNSGRIYSLSAASKKEFDDLLCDLQKKAKIARVQAEARTNFQKFQLKIRKRYETGKFQGVMALLILAVGGHPSIFLQFFNKKTLNKLRKAEFRVHHLRDGIHLSAHT